MKISTLPFSQLTIPALVDEAFRTGIWTAFQDQQLKALIRCACVESNYAVIDQLIEALIEGTVIDQSAQEFSLDISDFAIAC